MDNEIEPEGGPLAGVEVAVEHVVEEVKAEVETVIERVEAAFHTIEHRTFGRSGADEPMPVTTIKGA